MTPSNGRDGEVRGLRLIPQKADDAIYFDAFAPRGKGRSSIPTGTFAWIIGRLSSTIQGEELRWSQDRHSE